MNEFNTLKEDETRALVLKLNAVFRRTNPEITAVPWCDGLILVSNGEINQLCEVYHEVNAVYLIPVREPTFH